MSLKDVRVRAPLWAHGTNTNLLIFNWLMFFVSDFSRHFPEIGLFLWKNPLKPHGLDGFNDSLLHGCNGTKVAIISETANAPALVGRSEPGTARATSPGNENGRTVVVRPSILGACRLGCRCRGMTMQS